MSSFRTSYSRDLLPPCDALLTTMQSASRSSRLEGANVHFLRAVRTRKGTFRGSKSGSLFVKTGQNWPKQLKTAVFMEKHRIMLAVPWE